MNHPVRRVCLRIRRVQEPRRRKEIELEKNSSATLTSSKIPFFDSRTATRFPIAENTAPQSATTEYRRHTIETTNHR